LPWGKAMIRDAKEYIRRKGYRSIPFIAATYQYDMSTVPQYVNCGERSSSADSLGIDLTYVEERRLECRNVTSWMESGIIEEYRGYSIPTLLFYGCISEVRKDFSEIRAIFSNAATEVFSGVIIFGWFKADFNDVGRSCSTCSYKSKANEIQVWLKLRVTK
jgi:hypothetical protein